MDAPLEPLAEDEYYMRLALEKAREAANAGEVPVGCVIVRDGEILAAAGNRREGDKSALAHAELLAINCACQKLGGWRLTRCRLYVTLEPCPMCAGAIINARLPELIYGASDPKAGAAGSKTDLFSMGFNHRPAVRSGVLAAESASLLRDFFRGRRKRPNSSDIN